MDGSQDGRGDRRPRDAVRRLRRRAGALYAGLATPRRDTPPQRHDAVLSAAASRRQDEPPRRRHDRTDKYLGCR